MCLDKHGPGIYLELHSLIVVLLMKSCIDPHQNLICLSGMFSHGGSHNIMCFLTASCSVYFPGLCEWGLVVLEANGFVCKILHNAP